MNYILLLLSAILSLNSLGQHLDPSSIDPAILNKHILSEVNKLRKDKKVDTLKNEALLLPAAQDHTGYMSEREIMTHFQKSKVKKTPKNRVDFYGQQFANVGENVQTLTLNSIPKKIKTKETEIKTYEMLAKVLVHNWEHSPPHYANMISTDFTTTNTAVSIGKNGEIYACQLFGSDAYSYPKEFDKDVYPYKPHNERKCRNCDGNIGEGMIYVDSLKNIYYVGKGKKPMNRQLSWPWGDGVAADIVLKDQFPCGDNNKYNGVWAAHGIPLKPVFRKSFRKGDNAFRKRAVFIYLGKVPDWIDQEYEINLTLIKRKRTCIPIVFNNVDTWIYLDVNLPLQPDSAASFILSPQSDTLLATFFFDRSSANLKDSSLYQMVASLGPKLNSKTRASILGSASIEGTVEENTLLYQKRAESIESILKSAGCDSTSMKLTTFENYDAFRKDIINTPFAYLGSLSNENLKERLKDRKLRDSLQPILEKHRFATLTLSIYWNDTINLDDTNIIDYAKQSLINNQPEKFKHYYDVLQKLVLDKRLSENALDEIEIPLEKRFVQEIYDRLAVKALLNSENDSLAALTISQDTLNSLLELSPKNREINTHLAYLDYVYMPYLKLNDLYDSIQKFSEREHLDKRLHARMLINLGVVSDYETYFAKKGKKKYHYEEHKRLIRDAALNVDETFQLASYYVFFGDTKMAFDLTKPLIDNTNNPEHLVFFLKLIGEDLHDIPKKKYYAYFTRIRDLTGKEFCTYFNSPRLNFQILDDPEIKKIYCEECAL